MSQTSLKDVSLEIKRTNADCIIFYGSETGTAESYATRLANEGQARLGLKTAMCNPAHYDFKTLLNIPREKVVFFVLATAGDGEPTENAMGLYEGLVTAKEPCRNNSNKPLKSLNFVAFGLGDSTRDHYNAMIRSINSALLRLGATRIGDVGEGDDGEGTLEEDYLAWKDTMWPAFSQSRCIQLSESAWKPIFEIVPMPHLTNKSVWVYLGEHNEQHIKGQAKGPFYAQNPYLAPVTQLRELFAGDDRNCLHLEFDIHSSGLSYQTGDHVGVWPMNSEREINRLLKILGLYESRDSVIEIRPMGTMAHPLPSPTTYASLMRYYIDICGPVSRQFVATLAAFAPDSLARAESDRLGGDKDYFLEKVTRPHLNIGQLLEAICRGQTWAKLPFSLLLEGVPRLSPRFYSISSSSMEEPGKVSLTTVVESRIVPGRSERFHGVATNYLLALQKKKADVETSCQVMLSHDIDGPRNALRNRKVPLFVRPSTFKLLSDVLLPIIMVGPGTGVAPFRGFIRERMYRFKAGEKIGHMMLFFGCRNRENDFIYGNEFKTAQDAMGNGFELITAFSREGPTKVYVQHRMLEMAGQINRLLELGGHIYVCGEATNMARDVKAALGEIISRERGVSQSEAESIIRQLKTTNRYQEDVWA